MQIQNQQWLSVYHYDSQICVMHTMLAQQYSHQQTPSDVNKAKDKDQTLKAKDQTYKDKDQTPKDKTFKGKDQDKD